MDRTEYMLSRILGPRNRSKVESVDLMISKVDYDASGNPIYYGLAFQGTAASDAKWRIEKLNYDGSGNYTGSTYSGPDQVWNDRASVTYT